MAGFVDANRATEALARVPDAPPAPDGGEWTIITDEAVLRYADRLNALCRDIARRNPQLFAAGTATLPPADPRAAHGLPAMGAHQPAASVVAPVMGDGESDLLPLPLAGGIAPGLPLSVDCGPVERAAD